MSSITLATVAPPSHHAIVGAGLPLIRLGTGISQATAVPLMLINSDHRLIRHCRKPWATRLVSSAYRPMGQPPNTVQTSLNCPHALEAHTSGSAASLKRRIVLSQAEHMSPTHALRYARRGPPSLLAGGSTYLTRQTPAGRGDDGSRGWRT